MAKNITSQNVTIASSGTDSTSITMERNRVPVGVIIPSAITGTSFKYKNSLDDGTTLVTVYSGTTDYETNVAASKYVALNADVMQGIKTFQIIATTTQTAARTISVVMGEL